MRRLSPLFSNSVDLLPLKCIKFQIFVIYKTTVISDRKNTVKSSIYQEIPENDQNASPTNQKTAGSKLDRTS